MVKTKSRARTKQPEPEPPSRQPPRTPFLRRLFRPWLLAGIALVACGLVFGGRLKNALPDLGEQAEYRVLTRDIRITPPPHWVPQNLVEQVIRQAELPESLSLLDEELTTRIAAAFEQHPWVAEVVHVAKSAPAAIDVGLTYRHPVAMVQVKQGVYPVDPKGILLPPMDFAPSDTDRYPLIINAQSTPQGEAGVPWGDPAVEAAASLASVLTQHWKEFDLQAIEIPIRTAADMTVDDFVFHLYTNRGSRIIWGRAPHSQHPGELSAKQKIGRMEEYVSRFGGFDQPNGPYEIDIRHLQLISRKPLAHAVGQPAPRR